MDLDIVPSSRTEHQNQSNKNRLGRGHCCNPGSTPTQKKKDKEIIEKQPRQQSEEALGSPLLTSALGSRLLAEQPSVKRSWSLPNGIFPGGSVVKNLCTHCIGHGFNPW